MLIFAASAGLTLRWCASMSSMGDMPMPGGWGMSMAWMRTCGQTWLGVAVSFIAMWASMMVAMMTPSLGPALWRYRRAQRDMAHTDARVACAGVAYCCVWIALGIVVFPLGAIVSALTMQFSSLACAVPFATGSVVAIAGALQLTLWKTRRLACCRTVATRCCAAASDERRAASAWRDGWRFGVRCCACCAPLTAVLLMLGVMNVRAMIGVTILITAERLAPSGSRVAKAAGVIVMAAGGVLIARAVILNVA
ncbi:DUF2182 domain-containing protein [Paraburkholderia sp.]|uniref:DUF2182 domain-containing protein n=1 Tax=Paraburkholderia sp. TaxID=1926495 RepID=UPI0023A4459B|nr:DUF2182 domain-containing protein [Paraburkholderia sp.]MDE1179044.1 DUF2182 domain-containing protein [Paraburkholderia sp.]